MKLFVNICEYVEKHLDIIIMDCEYYLNQYVPEKKSNLC